MRARLILAAGTAAFALAGSVFAASPALAATANDTTAVTFTLTAGSLAIDAPTSKDLGSVGTSSTASVIGGALGTTTVTDARGGLLTAFTVTLSSSDFTTGTATATETISGATVSAYSGVVGHTNTMGVEVETTSAAPVLSGGAITSLTGYSGTDVATYDPTISIPIPATNVAGDYAGTITQTVTAV
jgi:hypothetical protein